MSYNYYNLDGIITELKKERAEKVALLEAWEKVTFPTKKDGTPFKIMSKNIDGATYKPYEHAMQYGEYQLHVYAWSKECGYVTDKIDAYNLVKYLKDAEMISKIQNYQPKQTYLEQVYTYDLDDIKTAVAARIEALRTQIEALGKQIEVARDALGTFKAKYAEAVQSLTDIAGERSDLFYYVRDTVQQRYPYI